MLDRVEDFLHYLSAERGSSKNTIDAYRNDLNGFARFAVERRAAGIANGANGTGQTNSNGNGSGNGAVAEAAVEAKSIDRQLVVDYLADLNRREVREGDGGPQGRSGEVVLRVSPRRW